MLMKARVALRESTGVRKTKQGDILIDLKYRMLAAKVIEDIRRMTEERLQLIALQDRTSLKIKNINPLLTKKELIKELSNELKIKEDN